MPAKVLIRHVPEWFGEQEPFVRAEVYIESSEELLDPDWSLGVESLSMSDLLRAGFERPLKCGLFLELPYRSSRPSRKAVLGAVPWLELLKDTETLLTHLLYRGWLLFRCPSREKATQLQAQVRGSFLRCIVLGAMNKFQGSGNEPKGLSDD